MTQAYLSTWIDAEVGELSAPSLRTDHLPSAELPIVEPTFISAWRRLPSPVRESTHRAAQVAIRAVTPALVFANWRPGNRGSSPIFIAGLFGSPSGVGQSARLFANAVESAGLDVRRVDVGPALGVAGTLDVVSSSASGAGILISFLNPPELIRWLARGGAVALKGKRHIGFWFWELQDAPHSWRRAFRYVDEVWCQSSFTAGAISSLAPSRVAVVTSPHPIFVTPRLEGDRPFFAINDKTCAILLSVDLRSTSARKNPLGALEAFQRAVPNPDPHRALLICKVRGGEAEPLVLESIERTAAAREDVILLLQDLSSERMVQLLASVDIALSLHRAEGFGLLAAEAIWLGKPVVTTGWSGVMDFLCADSAALVGWKPTKVCDPQSIYNEGIWAEPDLDDAANKLRDLIANPDLRRELGAKARIRAEKIFGEATWIKSTCQHLGHAEPG